MRNNELTENSPYCNKLTMTIIEWLKNESDDRKGVDTTDKWTTTKE